MSKYFFSLCNIISSDVLPSNYALDGELFLRRGAFEETTSIVSKKTPVDVEWRKIKYMVFDVPNSQDIFNRKNYY